MRKRGRLAAKGHDGRRAELKHDRPLGAEPRRPRCQSRNSGRASRAAERGRAATGFARLAPASGVGSTSPSASFAATGTVISNLSNTGYIKCFLPFVDKRFCLRSSMVKGAGPRSSNPVFEPCRGVFQLSVALPSTVAAGCPQQWPSGHLALEDRAEARARRCR